MNITSRRHAQNAGRRAHRILDWVWLGRGRLAVKTARFGWHMATERERNMIGGW